MKIHIYQVNMERDDDTVAFMNLDYLTERQPSGIRSEIYDKVFSGEVDCKNLEDVYRMFNLNHPAGYTGRSLSISDIVEVTDGGDVPPGCYFCDSFGFRKVAFEPDMTRDLTPQDTIRVVVVEPGKLARVADIDRSLAGMQGIVQGDLSGFYPFNEAVCIVCNDEHKLNDMPLNRAVYAEDEITDMSYQELVSLFRQTEGTRSGRHMLGYVVFSQDSFTEPYPEESRTYIVSSDNKAFIPGMGGYSIYGRSLDGSDPCVRLEQYMADELGGKDGWKVERCYTRQKGRMIDLIAGPFFICDCSTENFGSLSPEQLERYTEMFRYPERFIRLDDEIMAVPYEPKSRRHDGAR